MSYSREFTQLAVHSGHATFFSMRFRI
jgi:hypothetical protein